MRKFQISEIIKKFSLQIADRRGVGMWERETWVESMRALPYQLSEMVRTAAITRFVLLTAHGTKNAVVTTTNAARSAFDFGVRVGRWLLLQVTFLYLSVDILT